MGNWETSFQQTGSSPTACIWNQSWWIPKGTALHNPRIPQSTTKKKGKGQECRMRRMMEKGEKSRLLFVQRKDKKTLRFYLLRWFLLFVQRCYITVRHLINNLWKKCSWRTFYSEVVYEEDVWITQSHLKLSLKWKQIDRYTSLLTPDRKAHQHFVLYHRCTSVTMICAQKLFGGVTIEVLKYLQILLKHCFLFSRDSSPVFTVVM